MKCKDVNIELCESCKYYKTTLPCFLEDWENYFLLNTELQIEKELKYRLASSNYSINYYWNEALKYFRPDLFAIWEKFQLLK